jgi:GMP synthase (glutamine-hydrolysing)
MWNLHHLTVGDGDGDDFKEKIFDVRFLETFFSREQYSILSTTTPTPMETSPPLIIVDYGSQYTMLLARGFREIGVWCEIIAPAQIEDAIKPGVTPAVVFSGGPRSVSKHRLTEGECNTILNPRVPVLGVCYGMQLICKTLGAHVTSSGSGEYGSAMLHAMPELSGGLLNSDWFRGSEHRWKVWMSHGDSVDKTSLLEESLVGCATSCEDGRLAAVFSKSTQCWGVQFHPEVTHTQRGHSILKNFAVEIAGCPTTWAKDVQVEKCLQVIRDAVGPDDQVILALSGGVDSMVTAALLGLSLPPDQWRAVLVDHGFMRDGEVEEVVACCKERDIPLIVQDAHEEFYHHLQNVVEAEHKRKLIGTLFIPAFQVAVRKHLPKATMLAQGTIYPDVVESAMAAHSGKASQHLIKTHHNVGGLPKEMDLRVLEPLRWLFKDEVRGVGRRLGLPEHIVRRHPFPGPGLAIRIIGTTLNPEKVNTVRVADSIFLKAIRDAGLYDQISQAYAALLGVKAVGVVGDQRREGWVIVLRAVVTSDFMTANVFQFPEGFLETVANRIVNRCASIARVTYDFTSKPPGTIELE